MPRNQWAPPPTPTRTLCLLTRCPPPRTLPTETPPRWLPCTAERDQLLQEKADLNDRILRNRAEFDNYRRRTDREKQEYFEYAGMETIKQLLPVVDDLERALKMTAQTRPDEAATEFYKGNELIYGRLMELLKKLGLEPIPTIGTTFDPNLHEAIERVHTTDAEDQTILGEFQRGYRFKNRLLRPAMVKVAVAH